MAGEVEDVDRAFLLTWLTKWSTALDEDDETVRCLVGEGACTRSLLDCTAVLAGVDGLDSAVDDVDLPLDDLRPSNSAGSAVDVELVDGEGEDGRADASEPGSLVLPA